MKTNVRKSVSAFLTLCMLFGLFIIVDQPVMINAASAALTNTSTVSAETVKAGETFTAVASATGGTGFYQYAAYYRKASESKWTTKQNLGSNSYFSFVFDESGDYEISIKVKDSAGAEAKKRFNIKVADTLTNNSYLSTTATTLGSTITITGKATGGTGAYRYAFYYKKTDSSKWTTIQTYSTNSTVKITPADAATYDVSAKVKDEAGTIVKKSLKFTINEQLKNTSKISPSTIVLGSSIKVTCSSTGGTGTKSYAVWYKQKSSTSWTKARDYSTKTTVTVTPKHTGDYDIRIKAKDESGKIVNKTVTATITKAVELSNTSKISSGSITLGSSVTVTASATGGTSPYTYAAWYKPSSSSTWTTAQNYGTNTKITFKPKKATTYDVSVKVKDSKGTIVKKAFKLTVNSTLTEYNITYYIDNNDKYLKSLNIENPNPSTYYSEKGLELNDLMVDGYNFVGWFTTQTGGTRINEIAKGTTGNKTLYARWELVQYKVIFDSPDVPVDSIYYTVDTGATLKKPSIGGYTFVGWSDNGKIVKNIPKGTTGNLILHANWTSNRNQAEAVEKLDVPEVIEDYETGTILFIYEIGTIHNVPLSRIDTGENKIIGPSDGLNLSKTYKYSTMVDESYAKTVANAISNATTKSSEWTLSEDWNKTTQATDSHMEERAKTKEVTDEYGVVTGGKYYISNSAGGSTSSTISGGGSNSLAAKVTTDDSVGISSSYTHETEKGVSEKLTIGGKYHQEAEFKPEIGIGFEGASLSLGGMGVSTGFEISGSSETESYRKDKDSSTLAMSRNSSIGTEKSMASEAHWDASKTATSNWNTESGYEKSKTVSQNQSVSQAISDTINDRWEYSSMDSRGGSNSSTQSTGESQELKNEYASTVEYSTETKTELETTQNISRNEYGYYRLVNAGTAHVFAVVGYDIATNSYFTYTYNVLDKERHIFLDFSMKNALFDDCENAIIPFEIPVVVNDYVDSIMSGTDGLSIDEDGYISGKYEGTDDYVVIPEYVSIKNSNKTYSAVRVHGFKSEVFKNNKNIKGVYMPKYVTEIPASAFEGCTSLNIVAGYGITSIGANAFKECTSLTSFIIDKHITSLGNNAFEGVGAIDVTAANSNVADAAINSGAEKISLDLSNMVDSAGNPFKNKVLTINSTTKFFHIMSNNSTYNNISIKSDAKETQISNMIFKNNTKTPIDLSSSKVLLGQIKVENCSGLALILRNENTVLNLFGNVDLNSSADYTAISKNVTFSKYDPKLTSLLKTSSIYCICGEMKNPDLFSGTIKRISESEFEAILTSCKVTFNANGGTVSSDSQQAYYGQTYGTLPTPTKANYNFDGWYTAAADGTKITSDTVVTAMTDHTLYAHWSPKQYTVTFNGNGGTTYTTSKTVKYNSSYGTLPDAQRDYYTFTGWYTSDGTRIYDSTVFTGSSDITLYAHWNLHEPSGWVRKDSMPSGAQVVNTKWTYTEKSFKDSRNTSEAGYTLSSSEWVACGSGSKNYASFPGGFDTNNWYYQNWNTGAYGAYENATNKRVVSNYWDGFIYWHWMYDCGGANAYNRAIWNQYGYCSVNGYGYKYFGAFNTKDDYTVQGYNQYCNNCGMTTYTNTGRTSYNDSQGSYYWFRFDYYVSYYNDYYKLFHYYREDSKESSSKPTASSTVYNITEWVQYRAK